MSNYEAIFLEKIRDLECIATWASICSLGACRDHCRRAQAELNAELARLQQFDGPPSNGFYAIK